MDGKYCTLAQAKQYLLGTRTDPANPSVFNQGVINTPDDTLLSELLLQAEADFEMAVGTAFDKQTYTNVQPIIVFVDGNGWLTLFARERGPVTAVTSVQVRDLAGGSIAWTSIAWDADNIWLPPYGTSDTHPWPESWRVMIYPTGGTPPRSTGQLMARWSYTGGFATIPAALTAIIARMAAYLIKLREMPAGTVVNQPLGTMTVPTNYPPDLLRAIQRWSAVYP